MQFSERLRMDVLLVYCATSSQNARILSMLCISTVPSENKTWIIIKHGFVRTFPILLDFLLTFIANVLLQTIFQLLPTFFLVFKSYGASLGAPPQLRYTVPVRHFGLVTVINAPAIITLYHINQECLFVCIWSRLFPNKHFISSVALTIPLNQFLVREPFIFFLVHFCTQTDAQISQSFILLYFVLQELLDFASLRFQLPFLATLHFDAIERRSHGPPDLSLSQHSDLYTDYHLSLNHKIFHPTACRITLSAMHWAFSFIPHYNYSTQNPHARKDAYT